MNIKKGSKKKSHGSGKNFANVRPIALAIATKHIKEKAEQLEEPSVSDEEVREVDPEVWGVRQPVASVGHAFAMAFMEAQDVVERHEVQKYHEQDEIALTGSLSPVGNIVGPDGHKYQFGVYITRYDCTDLTVLSKGAMAAGIERHTREDDSLNVIYKPVDILDSMVEKFRLYEEKEAARLKELAAAGMLAQLQPEVQDAIQRGESVVVDTKTEPDGSVTVNSISTVSPDGSVTPIANKRTEHREDVN